jgi:hypothetical protein
VKNLTPPTKQQTTTTKPKMTEVNVDYYAVLNVPENATDDQIRQAYIKESVSVLSSLSLPFLDSCSGGYEFGGE